MALSRPHSAVFAALCFTTTLAASPITIFLDEMNSGVLNPQVNINAVGAIVPTLSYVPAGGVAGPVDGIAGGYTQYSVDSTAAGDPWYAGFGYYGAPGSPSPIHFTIPDQVPLQNVNFTFDGEAAGGNPLNVGVRVEAWDNNNSQELGVFYILPLTIGGSFSQIGGPLSTFSFFSPLGLTADQAKSMATDWRFNFSFAGTTASTFGPDDAAPAYGQDAGNVLSMDNVYFRYTSTVPEPGSLALLCIGLAVLARLRKF